jgi:3-oxoadipate enol-lactonase
MTLSPDPRNLLHMARRTKALHKSNFLVNAGNEIWLRKVIVLFIFYFSQMKKQLRYILLTVIVFAGSCNNKSEETKTGTIKAGNLHVFYERTGKGDAILLLHAGLQDHNMWNEQVKFFSKEYEVITIDLPYHGKTSGTDTLLLAQDLIKILLDSLRLNKVSIAGLSMGASITQDFIIAYPQRVNKAILISSGLNGFEKIQAIDSVSSYWWPQFKQALKEKDTARAAAEFTRAWAEGIYRRADSLKSPVSQQVYNTTLANLQLHKMENWPLLKNNPPAIEKLASIQVPVLIIDGDKDLPYITDASQYLEKNISKARRVVIKDAAHMLNLEKPEELNKLILDFLKQP